MTSFSNYAPYFQEPMREDDLYSMCSDHLDYEIDAQDPPPAILGHGEEIQGQALPYENRRRLPADQLENLRLAEQRMNRRRNRTAHGTRLYNFARNIEGPNLNRGEWAQRVHNEEPRAVEISDQYWESIGM